MGLDSVYLLTNVAKSDLSNTTITATVSVTATAGALFDTNSTTCANTGVDAYVRLEFQSTRSRPYSPSDYWWSTWANSLKLSTLAAQGPGTLQYSTANPAAWSNINGQNGTDPAAGFVTRSRASNRSESRSAAINTPALVKAHSYAAIRALRPPNLSIQLSRSPVMCCDRDWF